MSENLNRTAGDYQQYDSMTTEELEEILRLDSEAPPEQESDTQKLLYIMGVLADRTRQLSTPGKTTQQAWESFQQDYLNTQEPDTEDKAEQAQTEKPARPRLRRMLLIAAVIALLVGISVAVYAFGGEQVRNIVTKWTKGTFAFVSADQTGRSDSIPESVFADKTVRNTWKSIERKFYFVPTSVPDGFVMTEAETIKLSEKDIYRAGLYNGEKYLSITIETFLPDDPQYVHIDGEVTESYFSKGKEYYILSNNGSFTAVWIEGAYHCMISGDVSLEDMKKMIDSIGKE